jgi:hypothetical protein
MSSRELSPEWVLSSFIPPIAAPQHEISELIVVARRLWPRVQAHAHREQPGKSSDEALILLLRSGRECCARSRKRFSGPTGETGE